MNQGKDVESQPLQEDLRNLQRSSLALIVWSMIGAAFVLLCIAASDPAFLGPRIWLIVGPLAGFAVVTWLLSERVYPLAAATLGTGLIATIFGAASIYSSRDVLFVIPLVLFILPVLIDYETMVVVSVGAITLAWLVQHLGLVPLSGPDWLEIGLFCALSVGLAWLAYRPTHLALSWALMMFRSERQATIELRVRQAELVRMSKSFSDACERLERGNVTLAHAQREAEQARLLKEEFATAISHELRTPLNLIIGFTEMIVREPTIDDGGDVPSSFHGDIETIHRNACHLSDLVDDVLDLGRLDAHRLALHKKWSGLSDVVDDAVMAVDGLYQKTALQLIVDLPSDLPRLFVDPTRIRQVLINLLTNAVRYTDGGSVRVSAQRDGGDVIVSISDTGTGIPSDDLPYVFEGFRQAGNPHRRGGFGIGLTVSKRFVEMHAGAMWVTSESGRGTTFFFSLPVAENVVAVAAGPSRRALENHYLSQPESREILVVGPDVEAGRTVQRYLDGYHVHLTTSIAEARRVLHDEPIQAVIVSDSDRSAVDGLDLARRSSVPRVPALRCVVRTARLSGRELGVAAFLTKPVSQEQLHEALARLEGKPRRIVVVEDDPSMAELLGRMIGAIAPGCVVDVATDGEQGLAAVRSHPGAERANLVLLDLLMPGVDGHEFLRIWRSDPELHDIPVIVVSAASEENHDVIAGSSIEIQRFGGLSVGDLTRLVRASLDCLLSSMVHADEEEAAGTWRDLAEHGSLARTSPIPSSKISEITVDQPS